jgi:hypothetical protein
LTFYWKVNYYKKKKIAQLLQNKQLNKDSYKAPVIVAPYIGSSTRIPTATAASRQQHHKIASAAAFLQRKQPSYDV